MQRRLTLCLLVMLAACCVGRLSAQHYYTVKTSTGTYTDLANPVVLIEKPDTVGYGIPLPFAMEAFGLPVDLGATPNRVFIFTGGIIAVDVPDAQRLCVFDAFVARLVWRDSTSSLSYTVEGGGGERILKVQWKNLGMVGNPVGDFVNVQLWLSERDNSIEVHVGPNRATGSAAYYGYNGPAIGGFVSSYDFSVYYAAVHLTDNSTTPGVDEVQGYYAMDGTPANGTIYHFSYKKPASVIGAANAAMPTLTFAPNPCSDRSRIELPPAFAGTRPTMILHDALGREVLRMEDVRSGDYIERGALPAGIYYVSLREGGRIHDGGRLLIGE